MQTQEEFDRSNMKWVLLGMILLWLMIGVFMQGCASMEPSSTDHHNRVPQVYCNTVRTNQGMTEVCCQGERCWYAN